MAETSVTREEGHMLRKALTVIGLACVVLIASAYKNEQSGFRGMNWGVAVPEAWGEKVAIDESYGGIDIYHAPDEDLTLGCATLESVEYSFWQGKLCNVTVNFEGFKDFSCIHDAVKEKFGVGFRPNQFMERYFWSGKVTNILLDYNKASEKGQLHFTSKLIMNQQEAWAKAQAKKGAQSGF